MLLHNQAAAVQVRWSQLKVENELDRITFLRPIKSYSYRSLAKEQREFRTLELLPRSASAQAPLQCRIQHVSADRHKELDYEAISYCWGDPSPDSMIEVDGTTLPLPINSEKALRRMALVGRKRTVYLDAVCINQQDPEERASQVLLMGDIYRYAQSTLVYLGDADETTAPAYANLRLLHLEVKEDVKATSGLAELTGLSEGKVIKAEQAMKSLVDTERLIQLFRRPWFQRVWIVQEVALATNASLMCGPHEIDMKIVLEVASWLFMYQNNHINPYLFNALSNANGIWRINHYVRQDGGLLISNILRYSRDLKASDTRDKVFGMLGLLNQTVVTQPLIPDYAKSTADVFQEAVRQCLADRKQPLWIFRFISHREDDDLQDSGFPSWVPRFDRLRDIDLDASGLVIHGEKGALGDIALANEAANSTDEEPHVLFLKGLELFLVEDIGETFDNSLVRRDTWAQTEACATWSEQGRTMLQGHDIPHTTYARALLANNDTSNQPSSQEFHQGLAAILQHHRDQIDVPPVTELDDSSSTATKQVSEYRKAMVTACSTRKLALMSNGNMGIVPKLTKRSDIVAVLHGGTTPVVLRSHGDEYLLLGECYVDGWMSWQEHGDELERRMLDESPKVFRIR